MSSTATPIVVGMFHPHEMHIHVHVHFDATDPDPKVGQILERVQDIQSKEIQMTDAVAGLSATLDNIQADITGLKDAAAAASAAQDEVIAQLRVDLAAALAAGDPAAVQAAIDAAVATATQGFNDALQPIIDKANAIDVQTPPTEEPPTV